MSVEKLKLLGETMLYARLFSYVLLCSAFVLGCAAPKTSTRAVRFRGYEAHIRQGLVPDQVREFLTRLSDQGLLPANQIKTWLDTQALPEHQHRLLRALFRHGWKRNPDMLSLGTKDEATHLAVSVLRPDVATAAMLAGPEVTRPRGWSTRSGAVLMHLSSGKQPKVVGWLLLKNHNSAMAMVRSEGMVPLDVFERLHGLTGIVREV